MASALNGLGDVAAATGDYAAARQYQQQSLNKYRQIDDRWGIARVQSDLASIDLLAGDYAAADDSLRRALVAFRGLGHQRGVARQLEALSWCAGCQTRHGDAVVLASAAAALRLKIGSPAKQTDLDKIDRTLSAARLHLSAEAFADAWRAGQEHREGMSRTLDRILGFRTAPNR